MAFNKISYLLLNGFLGLLSYVWHPRPNLSGKKIPIVLVNGWFARNTQCLSLKRRLESLGHPVYTPSLGWLLGRIDSKADALHRQIKDIGPCIYIGYSAGGLLGMYYYKHYKTKIKCLIALGTPFHGTVWAYYATLSRSARQMLPHSLFIKNLARKPLKNMYSIGSKEDEMVPYPSTRLKFAENTILEKGGHISLVYSREAFERIRSITSDYVLPKD